MRFGGLLEVSDLLEGVLLCLGLRLDVVSLEAFADDIRHHVLQVEEQNGVLHRVAGQDLVFSDLVFIGVEARHNVLDRCRLPVVLLDLLSDL